MSTPVVAHFLQSFLPPRLAQIKDSSPHSPQIFFLKVLDGSNRRLPKEKLNAIKDLIFFYLNTSNGISIFYSFIWSIIFTFAQ